MVYEVLLIPAVVPGCAPGVGSPATSHPMVRVKFTTHNHGERCGSGSLVEIVVSREIKQLTISFFSTTPRHSPSARGA